MQSVLLIVRGIHIIIIIINSMNSSHTRLSKGAVQ